MQDIVMNVLGMICCAMSIIGGLIIVVSYYKLPELKTFGNKMIMYVGMSNIIYSLQTFIEFLFDLNELYEDEGMRTICMIQAFISTYTSECTLIWITILSLTIHDTVKNKIQNMARREKIFIIMGFVIPLVLSVIPFISKTYGRENGVCWITSEAGKAAELSQVWGLFYGPLWICIFLNFSLILSTMRMLKALDIGNTETYFVIRRFLYYPFLWIACWLAGTINRSIVSAGGQGIKALTDVALVLTTSQGFFTMLIFLSDKRILDAIRNRSSLSKTQVCCQDQCNGEEDINQENSQFQSKLLDVDDQDDYFNYYNSDNNQNQQKKQNDTHPSQGNYQTNDSDSSSLLSKTEQQNQWTSVNPQTSSLKLSSDSYSSQNNSNINNQQHQPRSPNKQNPNNSSRKKGQKRGATQKQQFQTSGQWNRLEKIEEDSDEELFDKEIQMMNIKTPEQLFLSKRDTKLLYKQRKISNANHNQSENLHKRQQE